MWYRTAIRRTVRYAAFVAAAMAVGAQLGCESCVEAGLLFEDTCPIDLAILDPAGVATADTAQWSAAEMEYYSCGVDDVTRQEIVALFAAEPDVETSRLRNPEDIALIWHSGYGGDKADLPFGKFKVYDRERSLESQYEFVLGAEPDFRALAAGPYWLAAWGWDDEGLLSRSSKVKRVEINLGF